MDFPTQLFFSDNMIPTAHLSQRRLCSNDRKSVGKYIQAVYGYLLQHSVFHKMQTLMDSKKPNHVLLEQIDREISRACKHGEKICKARRADYWNVSIHLLNLHASVLNQVCKRKAKGYSIISLTSRAKAIGIFINHEDSLP